MPQNQKNCTFIYFYKQKCKVVSFNLGTLSVTGCLPHVSVYCLFTVIVAL